MFDFLMRRKVFLFLALAGAVVALLTPVLVPVHLRALDPRVLQESTRQGKSLLLLAEDSAPHDPSVAKVLLRAAENLDLPGTEDVLGVLRESAPRRPAPRTVLQQLERAAAGWVEVQEIPVLTALRHAEDRELLADSIHSPSAVRILMNRSLTNLTLFAPVRSGAGYPFDAAILTTAYLMDQGAFSGISRTDTTLKEQVLGLSARGGSTNQVAALEEFYLDMFGLAKRFSSEQMVVFVSNIQSFDALDRLARFLQDRPGTMPLIFSAVVMSRDGDHVAQYLRRFPQTGLADLRFGLERTTQTLARILSKQEPIYRTVWHNRLLSAAGLGFLSDPLLRFTIESPSAALLAKWVLLLIAGLCAAYSWRLGRGSEEEEPIYWTPQFGFARRLMFAVVFMALTVLLGEPYLAQGEAEEKPPARATFPIFSAATPLAAQPPSSGFMINPSTLIAMAVFLVLQSSIYIFCLTKLAEIRRQGLSSPMKLRLLENEENLFDAGLYLGLFGTAASLILLTLGLIKPSLVSAYSSTLFGILFVALLKIFHVRPYKRRLIIDSATQEEALA